MDRLFFLLSLLIFLCTGQAQAFNLGEVGDAPSYVSVPLCPGPAQIVISQKNFPVDLIHSCTSDSKEIEGQKVDFVRIAYGAAQDCPAGCFYAWFTGVVVPEEPSVIELPAYDETHILMGMFAQAPFQGEAGMLDFACPADIEKFADVTLAEQNGFYGWRATFHQPYSCQWKEVTFTRVTYENKFLHTGHVMSRIFEGGFFVYLKEGKVVWDFGQLKTSERQLKSFKDMELK